MAPVVWVDALTVQTIFNKVIYFGQQTKGKLLVNVYIIHIPIYVYKPKTSSLGIILCCSCDQSY